MASLSTDRLTMRGRTGVLVPITLGFLAAFFWLAWQAIRLPILALLVMFEPIVDVALSTLALLIALTALFWSRAGVTLIDSSNHDSDSLSSNSVRKRGSHVKTHP